MNPPDVFIVGAARTPIGRFLGGLSSLKASDLGAIAIREAMSRAGVTGGEIDEVLMGHVVTAGQGQARADEDAVVQLLASENDRHFRFRNGSGLRLVDALVVRDSWR